MVTTGSYNMPHVAVLSLLMLSC